MHTAARLTRIAGPFLRACPGLLVAVLLCALPLTAEEPRSAEAQVQLAAQLAPSLVQVAYTLQYDKGEAPRGTGWGERCPNCGQFHGNPLESLVRDERPLLTAGFLVSPTQLVAPDIQVHPRFIQTISVRRGDQVAEARISALARDCNAVLIEIPRAFPGTRPLEFDASKEGPYLAATYTQLDGDWALHVQPLSTMVTVPLRQPPFIPAPSYSLILDRDGSPVALSMAEKLPVDDTWKGSPLDWPMITSEALQQRLGELEERTTAALMRVSLGLRSPRSNPNEYSRYSSRDDDATQIDTLGLLFEPDRVLVLSSLPPRVTARLEHIHLDHPEQGLVPARFSGSFKHIGALEVSPESSLAVVLEWSDAPIASHRDQILLMADISMQGDQRIARFSHSRISSLDIGWKGQVYPEFTGRVQSPFLFDLEGRLVALPIGQRETNPMERSYSQSYSSRVTPVPYVLAHVSDTLASHDAANVPLSAEEESRLAWLGIELQPLNRDLARANEVSDQTRDGNTGALVTHVYAASPAAQAGIEPGMILLRLHTPDRAQPMEVRVDDSRSYHSPFPWDQLDEIPEQYFDQIPSPWPSAETGFARILTDLGIGSVFTADFFHDGEVIAKPFTVVAGPSHYESAPRYRAEELGLTVRDMTYEVRRYLQRDEEEPGVVVSRVEAGTRASIAGIKPYELITHVNNEPMHTVADFERLTAAEGELRLSIIRMATGRLVRITAPGR